MNKIESDFFEFILGDTMCCFDIPVPAKFTWQQLYFTNLAYELFKYDNAEFSQKTINTFKESFLLWQNKNIPSFEWIDISIKDTANIVEFSHTSDYSWNSLDAPILLYCQIHMNEIGCKTYQESIRDNFLNWEE